MIMTTVENSCDRNAACYHFEHLSETLLSRGAGDRGRALASRGKKWTGVANNMQVAQELFLKTCRWHNIFFKNRQVAQNSL